jgi:hypothetical protein
MAGRMLCRPEVVGKFCGATGGATVDVILKDFGNDLETP